ncbi:MAG: tRNA preQ1(34) S-adenosylmethionine ribosyltransferase-isomerase QueA [Erysipelotrichaceae bacterium]|nr:tRNA preQ1(34) S-adenosylmethionine ribosyltransferase-isomerase QueA [Erysipelotrichaceae bacterium]
MKKEDFYYDLPQELIAQVPLKDRTASRLMTLNKRTGEVEHHTFTDILDFLQPGDVLVRNNSRVIPARLFGTKKETGAHVELLLLRQEGNVWECLVGNAKVVKLGTVVSFGEDKLLAKCTAIKENGLRDFEMIYEGVFNEILNELGETPLPPYIHEKLQDKNRYQTVYAKVDGSAAAPTAGLHFTEDLFEKIKAKGVEVLDVTLHVGLGTFKPLKEEEVTDHIMHEEYYSMTEEVAERLNLAKEEGRRIIAIGTTSCRTLESVMQKYGKFCGCSGNTGIYIYPGYEFLAIDALITNFHLPESTLILLVSALAGRENILHAYQLAIEEKYRFFSFGDAMFIY